MANQYKQDMQEKIICLRCYLIRVYPSEGLCYSCRKETTTMIVDRKETSDPIPKVKITIHGTCDLCKQENSVHSYIYIGNKLFELCRDCGCKHESVHKNHSIEEHELVTRRHCIPCLEELPNAYQNLWNKVIFRFRRLLLHQRKRKRLRENNRCV